MSTVNKYLLPHRATKDVMKDASKSSMVLRKGELFVEAPSTGIGTGHSKIKIGDGKTIYSNLPYALGDTDNEVTNAIITFISNTGTSAKDVINGVKSGQSLATQIAGLKQAIVLITNTPFTNKAFSTISDGGNQSIAATGTGDTLKVTAGDNVTLTMDNSAKSIKIAAKDTTYNNATTATSGLMSSGDKKRLDGISDGANKTAVEQKLFSGTNIGSVTIDGEKTELFAPTNTHYEAKNVVNNSSTSTSNTSTAVDNGNVTLNLVEDGKVRSSHKISGSGATKVTTDASGNIIVSSTDNNTTYGQASDTKVGLTKIYGIYGDNTDGSVTQQFFTGEMNKKLNSDGTAVKATQDSLGNNIAEYFKDASVNGQTVTFVRGNGTTFEIHTQDTNNKYYDFKGATTAANGGNGLVPAPSSAQTGYYLRGDGTWHSPSDVKVDKAGMADKASTATADSAGNNINTTYIKSVTGSNATVTVTKGNGATTSFTINNVSSATSAGSARSASTATADSSGQQINTTYVKGVTGAAAVVTVTKGDGTTTGFTVDGVKSASSATADSAGQNINTTYIKGVTGSNATVTVTKGNGATSAFIVNNVGNAGTATYAESASTATVDSAGQQINTTYIKSLSVSGRTITYTKGNGATGAITTQDNNTTYGAFKGATSSANGGSGLVPAPTTAQKDQYLKGDGTWASISNVISGTKVDNASTADYASSASSASTATADSAGQQINTTYIKGVTGSNATLTVTKGNGSTSAFTVNNVSNAAKASTATADSAGQQINTTYIKSITYSGHTVTVTKGNGSTSTFDTADNNTTYATGNETTSGLTKLYGSSGTSTDGTMTRAAITKLVNDTKTTLETAIGNINSFEIIVLADGETLPTTGANHTVYFVPDASGDADTKYAEYIWLTDYYEKIGMTTADLTNYYTKSETDNKISSATDSLVSSLSYSGHTLTITKKNGTTSSFNTTDNNTTYSAGTGLSLSGTTFSINAGASTVAHASSADSSTNDSAGNNINNTYVKGITYSGHTVTITKGNGATTSFNTADNNTTYDVFKGATNSANGGSGLVPAPTTAQTGMYLKGDGTWANISGVIAGTKVNNASTADYASSAANSAKATNDSAGQNINTTYIKSLSVSGRTITYTKGNGATGAITTQDNNTTYGNFAGATASANGGSGLVPAPTTAQKDMYLKGDGTWANISGVIVGTKVTSAANADSAGKATNDSAGQNINTTYIKSLSVSGRTITYTKGNGATGTITTQDTDTNTTYSAGTGLTLSGTTFSINAGASTVAYATNAGNGISNITRSGTTFTVTRQNGSTFSFNQQDTNTTYGLASQSSNGLMSAADKKAVDREFFRMVPKGGTYIPENADLNSIEYIKVGNYYNTFDRESTTIKNIPVIQSPYKAFMMYVLSPLLEVYDNESTDQWVYRLRIFVTYTGDDIFVQKVDSGATAGMFNYGPWVKMTNSNDLDAVSNTINTHIAKKSNPHKVTKDQVGLGSVANLDQSKAIKSITRDGTTFTATSLDGTVSTFTQQDTNTTYDLATSSADGLMSAEDKKAIDREFFRMLPKGGTEILNGADLNSTAYLKVGIYYQTGNVHTTNMTNIPFKAAFMMYVLSPLSEVYDNESTAKKVYRLRIFVEYTGNYIFTQTVYSYNTAGSFTYGPWVKMTNSNDLDAVSNTINTHIAKKSNPHKVTKDQVGLGSVANLDQSKAIKSITRSGTTFTATALDGTTTTFTQQDGSTTYSVATSSADGLMSKEDKAKLDGLSDSGIHYVPFELVDDYTCSTTDSFDTVMSMIQSNKPVQASVNADGKVISLPVFMYDAEEIMFRNDEMYIIYPSTAEMLGDNVLAIYGYTLSDKLQDNDTTETSGQAALDAHMGKVLSDRINAVKTGAIDQIVKNTAQIETAGTATNAHSAGEYVMISNALYKVIASVAKGDTWTIGTNVTAANIGSEITTNAANIKKNADEIATYIAGQRNPDLLGKGAYIGRKIEGGGTIFFDYAIGFSGGVYVAPITENLHSYHVDPLTGVVMCDDPEDTTKQDRFMVVSDYDIGDYKHGNNLTWSNGTSGSLYTAIGTATEFGTGKANTEKCIAAATTDGLIGWNTNAYNCIWHYVSGGDWRRTTDRGTHVWFVPSKDELTVLLYMQWSIASKRKSYDGKTQLIQLPINFYSNYWSSSEDGAMMVFQAYFCGGAMDTIDKSYAGGILVRLVRTF